jgi:hypothetical protein
MSDTDRSTQPSSSSSRQLVDPPGFTGSVSHAGHGSINVIPFTAGDLKRLKFESPSTSTSTASQSSSGVSSEVELENSQKNCDKFLERVNLLIFVDAEDPPLDHLDDSSVERTVATADLSPPIVVAKRGSSRAVPEMNDKRRGNGPVDLDEVDNETIDGNDFDQPQQSVVVETDPTCLVDVVTCDNTGDHPQAEKIEDGTSRCSNRGDLDMTFDLESGLVDLDAVHDREADFDMIWKEHEDSFFAWKNGNKDGETKKFGNSSRKRSEEPSAFKASARKKRDEATNKSFRRGNAGGANLVPVTDIYQDLAKTSASATTELCRTDDVVSLCSMDTYGFSLSGESMDSYGFSLVESIDKYGKFMKDRKRRVSQPTTGDEIQEDFADLIAEIFPLKGIPVDSIENTDECFEEIAVVADDTKINQPTVGTEESRARMIRRINEILKREQSDTSTEETPPATKARGLRAMRLKSRNRAYGAIGAPAFATVHEHEEMPSPPSAGQEESKAHFDGVPPLTDASEDTFGLVVQIREDHADWAQSVVSEISTLSDKLWIKTNPTAESKWEDLSSVGLNGVEVRSKKNVDAILVNPYDELEIVGEAEGREAESPPIYYDPSVKTPPFLFCQIADADAFVENRDDSKWDDVSSIGLTGVEGPAGRKMAQTSNAQIAVVRTREEDSRILPQSKEKSRKNSDTTERNPNARSIFRTPSNNNHQPKKPSVISNIELNPTFSTVWVGDSDISGSIDSHDPEDPEKKFRKEVSNTSTSSKSKCQLCLRWKSRSLTPRCWWIVVAISVLAVTAICIVVVYVYTSL